MTGSVFCFCFFLPFFSTKALHFYASFYIFALRIFCSLLASSLLRWLCRLKMEWFGLVFFLCSASGHLSSVSSTSNSLYGKYSSYNVGYRESEIASLLPQSLLRPYFYPSLKSYEARRSDEVTRVSDFFFVCFVCFVCFFLFVSLVPLCSVALHPFISLVAFIFLDSSFFLLLCPSCISDSFYSAFCLFLALSLSL